MPDGYYFAGKYPEAYHGKLNELQDLLRRQRGILVENCACRDSATLGFLRGRRSSQRDLVQIEIAKLRSPRVLVANREVILDVAAWRADGLQNAARVAGFHDRGGGCGRFVRLVNNRTRRNKDAAGIAGMGQPNTLAVTASVGKGIGGPDPVCSPFPKGKENFENYNPYKPKPGERPIVAVIDTGIPGNEEDGLPTMIRGDGWLQGVERSESNRDLLDHLPLRDGYLDYQAGHGTFVAGVVQRVAPTAEIKVYRAADTDGFADDITIAEAVRRAADDGAKIINLSLGMVTLDNEPPPALKAAVEDVTADEEVVIVAAAGNFGDKTKCWPAAFDEVLAVGALTEPQDVGDDAEIDRTRKFEPAEWSSKGDYINFWTVGEGVRSTFVTGYESPLFDHDPEVFPPDAWVLWSGTSFAAPQIAGAIARLQHELGKKPSEAVALLCEEGAEVKGQKGKALRILSGIRID